MAFGISPLVGLPGQAVRAVTEVAGTGHLPPGVQAIAPLVIYGLYAVAFAVCAVFLSGCGDSNPPHSPDPIDVDPPVRPNPNGNGEQGEIDNTRGTNL